MELLLLLSGGAAVVAIVLNRMLSEQVSALRRRVEFLETRFATTALPAAAPSMPPMPATTPQPPTPTPTPPAAPVPHAPAATPVEAPPIEPPPLTPPTPRPVPQWQRTLAEHALAIAGGAFVLAAAIFFVGYAVDQGWIGPELRVALAFAFGLALVAVAVRLASRLDVAERTGRAIGSLHGVLAGVGVGVSFLAIVSGVRIEDVLGAPLGIAAAILVAVLAVVIAQAWRSQDLAAFGIVSALASPILLDAEPAGSTLALMAVALVGAAVVAVMESWPRLLPIALVVSAPQVIAWADGDVTWTTAILVAFAWWGVLGGGALVESLRRHAAPSHSAVSTLLGAPLVVGSTIATVLDPLPADLAEDRFAVAMVLFGALQLLVAAAVYSRQAVGSSALVASLLGAGATSLALATSVASNGPAATVAWSAEAAAMALVWWQSRSRVGAAFAIGAALVAVLGALVVDAPPTLLHDPDDTLRSLVDPLLAVGGLLVSAVGLRIAAPLVRSDPPRTSSLPTAIRALDATVGTLAWYAIALLAANIATDRHLEVAVGTWAAAGGLLAVWLSQRLARSELAVLGGVALLVECLFLTVDQSTQLASLVVYGAFATLAAAPLVFAPARVRHRVSLSLATASQVALGTVVLLRLLPPDLLRTWGDDSVAHAVLVLALWLAGLAIPTIAASRSGDPRERRVGAIGASLAVLYAISLLVVAVMTDQPNVTEQAPQVALTLTWVTIGVALLFAAATPRLRAHREPRIGAYALLGVAGAKLLLLDTAELDTPARVLAFLATGVGLLGASWLEQRLRGLDASDGSTR